MTIQFVKSLKDAANSLLDSEPSSMAIWHLPHCEINANFNTYTFRFNSKSKKMQWEYKDTWMDSPDYLDNAMDVIISVIMAHTVNKTSDNSLLLFGAPVEAWRFEMWVLPITNRETISITIMDMWNSLNTSDKPMAIDDRLSYIKLIVNGASVLNPVDEFHAASIIFDQNGIFEILSTIDNSDLYSVPTTIGIIEDVNHPNSLVSFAQYPEFLSRFLFSDNPDIVASTELL